MSNMSYCRFENTSNDFEDCLDALYNIETKEDLDELSTSEKRHLKKLYKQAQKYVEQYENIGD